MDLALELCPAVIAKKPKSNIAKQGFEWAKMEQTRRSEYDASLCLSHCFARLRPRYAASMRELGIDTASAHCSRTGAACSRAGLEEEQTLQRESREKDRNIRMEQSRRQYERFRQQQEAQDQREQLFAEEHGVDYYKILELGRDASTAEIKKAYRSLAKKFHPDRIKGGDEASRKSAQSRFEMIADAYEALMAT